MTLCTCGHAEFAPNGDAIHVCECEGPHSEETSGDDYCVECRETMARSNADAYHVFKPTMTIIDDATPPIIEAPWTPEQVEALNAYQTSGAWHPFTCANRDPATHEAHGRGDYGVLIATPAGWVCEDCNYTQNWAHRFMAETDDGFAATAALLLSVAPPGYGFRCMTCNATFSSGFGAYTHQMISDHAPVAAMERLKEPWHRRPQVRVFASTCLSLLGIAVAVALGWLR